LSIKSFLEENHLLQERKNAVVVENVKKTKNDHHHPNDTKVQKTIPEVRKEIATNIEKLADLRRFVGLLWYQNQNNCS